MIRIKKKKKRASETMKNFTEQVAAAKNTCPLSSSLFHFIISMMIYQYGEDNNKRWKRKEK